MQNVFILMTHRCQRSCGYCFEAQLGVRKAGVELPAARLAELAVHLVSPGRSSVIISGGEPLLRPDCEALIAALSRDGIPALLISNGDALSEERSRSLAAAGLMALTLSAADFVQVKDAAAAAAAVNRLVQLLEGARAAGIPGLSVIYLISSTSFQHLPSLVQRIEPLGVSVLPQPLCGSSAAPLTGALSPRALPRDTWREIWSMCGISSRSMYTAFVDGLYGGLPTKPAWCGMGGTAAVLEPDGEVFACFHRRDLQCGNLHSGNPAAVRQRLKLAAMETATAACFGEHCVSLFSGR